MIASERNQGRAPDMGWLDHDRLGYNYRLSETQAALGVVQLGRLNSMLQGRQQVADLYADALAEIELLELPTDSWEGGTRGWFVYVVTLSDGVDRESVIGHLRSRGIDCKPYLPALHLMDHLAAASGAKAGEFPVAEAAAARGLALPFHPTLTAGEIERVAAALAGAVSHAQRA